MQEIAIYDGQLKKLTSMRDGVHEYLGVELDIEPPDKVFKVFRSQQTVKDVVQLMDNLVITDNHVSTDSSPQPHKIGLAITPKLESVEDTSTDTTVVISHKASVDDKLLGLLDSGKKQLSLGYKGKLIESDKYDFEQVSITPHHLALIDRGRCGVVCQFNDKEKYMFTLEELSEKVAVLAPAGGKEFTDALADLVKFKKEKEAKEGGKKEEVKDMDKEEETKLPKAKVETKDEKEEGEAEEKKDEKPKKGVIPENFKDSIEFKDAVLSMAKEMSKAMAKAMSLKHCSVVEKARQFLPSDYKFADNLPCRIQRDAIKTQIADDFEDSELDAAFKMLTHNKDYATFGDSKADDLLSLSDKEL